MKNRSLQFIVFISMALILGACGKKSDSKRANLSRGRTNAYQNQVPSPATANTYNSEYGAIYDGSYDMSAKVAAFLGSDQVTSVSGQMNQTTGIVFKGQVDAMGSSGQAEIYIWDQEATNSGQVISATGFQLIASESRVTQTQARLVFQDEFGKIIFDGAFNDQQGLFQGTVSFQNHGGSVGSLGQFITGNCSFVRCHGY